MEIYLFILFASFSVASALGLILSRNTINSALFLLLNLLAVAGLYLLLKAQFLAVVQVLVYAGAIMVLFLFVIMLLNLGSEDKPASWFSVRHAVAFVLGVTILSHILYALSEITGIQPKISSEMDFAGTVEALSDVLYTTYMMPVLATAMLLTAAVVGALLLARKSGTKNGTS